MLCTHEDSMHVCVFMVKASSILRAGLTETPLFRTVENDVSERWKLSIEQNSHVSIYLTRKHTPKHRSFADFWVTFAMIYGSNEVDEYASVTCLYTPDRDVCGIPRMFSADLHYQNRTMHWLHSESRYNEDGNVKFYVTIRYLPPAQRYTNDYLSYHGLSAQSLELLPSFRQQMHEFTQSIWQWALCATVMLPFWLPSRKSHSGSTDRRRLCRDHQGNMGSL